MLLFVTFIAVDSQPYHIARRFFLIVKRAWTHVSPPPRAQPNPVPVPVPVPSPFRVRTQSTRSRYIQFQKQNPSLDRLSPHFTTSTHLPTSSLPPAFNPSHTHPTPYPDSSPPTASNNPYDPVSSSDSPDSRVPHARSPNQPPAPQPHS